VDEPSVGTFRVAEFEVPVWHRSIFQGHPPEITVSQRQVDIIASEQVRLVDEELSHRRAARGENRLPPAAAVIVAGVVYALLPESLLFAPRFVIPAVELALLVALTATNPRRAADLAAGHPPGRGRIRRRRVTEERLRTTPTTTR
jgi:hypothetical protein